MDYLAGIFEGKAPTLSIHEAEGVIEYIAQFETIPTGRVDGAKFANILSGQCPVAPTGDGAVFMKTLSVYLAAKPRKYVEALVNPTTGLATKQFFGLKIADVEKAMSEMVARRDRILANARWAKEAEQKRIEEAAEDAKLRKEQGSLEQRKATVAKLMSGLRLKTFDDVEAERKAQK